MNKITNFFFWGPENRKWHISKHLFVKLQLICNWESDIFYGLFVTVAKLNGINQPLQSDTWSFTEERKSKSRQKNCVDSKWSASQVSNGWNVDNALSWPNACSEDELKTPLLHNYLFIISNNIWSDEQDETLHRHKLMERYLVHQNHLICTHS